MADIVSTTRVCRARNLMNGRRNGTSGIGVDRSHSSADVDQSFAAMVFDDRQPTNAGDGEGVHGTTSNWR